MYLGVNIQYWKKPIDLRVVEYVCVLRHICATYLSEEMLLIKRSESHIKRVIKLKKIAVEVILASLLFLPRVIFQHCYKSRRKGSKCWSATLRFGAKRIEF